MEVPRDINNIDTSSDGYSTDSASENMAEICADVPNLSREHTASFRSGSWNEIKIKVKRVLGFMEMEQINLPLFLDALSWGHDDCIDDPQIQQARSTLMNSDELPTILRRWWKPPRSTTNHMTRAEGACSAMENFALICICEAVQQEMTTTADFLQSHTDEFSTEELEKLTINGVIDDMKKKLPVFWRILIAAGTPPSKSKRAARSKRSRTKITMIIIAKLAYLRNQNYNLIQRLLAIYFKFQGVSAKGFDTLHYFGLTMSMKWTTLCVDKLAHDAQSSLLKVRDNVAWLLTYDNVNIAFEVFSQRLNNKTHFDSGTAGTCYIKPNVPPLPAAVASQLHEQRATGIFNPITLDEIAQMEVEAMTDILPYTADLILQTLLHAPEFNFSQYKHRTAVELQSPPPISGLPWGPEYAAKQIIMGTVKVDESTYEGNLELIHEWLDQLGLSSEEEETKTGEEQIIVIAGDQLTVSRARELYKMRAEDYNSFDRLDYLLLLFGWLHAMMAYGNSLFKQYFGSTSGRGLQHAATLLKRKGLTKILTKGPFYHDLDELLHHVLEAHIRGLWKTHVGVDDLSCLRDWSPVRLKEAAALIQERYASTSAIARCQNVPLEDEDELQQQTVMMVRDLLLYVNLQKAIKFGDVGIMEKMLPHLLFRFQGGKNSHYAVEVLELLQGLHKEWPNEVCDFVRHHGWLLNFQGKRHTHLAFDMAQEHNIRDIKVTYMPDGPNSDWSYLKKISWAIPQIRRIAAHLEFETKTLTRGKKHTIPQKQLDIELLEKSFIQSKIYTYSKGRRVDEFDFAHDFAAEGFLALHTGETIKQWNDKRAYKRFRMELHEGDEYESSLYESSLEEDSELEDMHENEMLD